MMFRKDLILWTLVKYHYPVRKKYEKAHLFVMFIIFTFLTDLENLVQSSKYGVIVVSFGSNVKYLPDRLIVKMVNAFERRKELFLMRFDMYF